MAGFSYLRQDLRRGSNFVEFDYERIDPRTHLRRIQREIQEVQNGAGFKYATEEPTGENPVVTSENVGTETGRVEGRLIAHTNWEKFAGDETETESSPILPLIAGLLGVVIVIAGLTAQGNDQATILGVGVLVLIGAGLIYYLQDPTVNRNEYFFRKRVRILMEGEVAEHGSGSAPSDLVASDLSVIYSENLEIERRTGSGRQTLMRNELPDRLRNQLATQQTPITTEIEVETADAVACSR